MHRAWTQTATSNKPSDQTIAAVHPPLALKWIYHESYFLDCEWDKSLPGSVILMSSAPDHKMQAFQTSHLNNLFIQSTWNHDLLYKLLLLSVEVEEAKLMILLSGSWVLRFPNANCKLQMQPAPLTFLISKYQLPWLMRAELYLDTIGQRFSQ